MTLSAFDPEILTTQTFLESAPMTQPPVTTIAQEPPDQPEIHAFFAASEAYMSALYPAESNHFIDMSTLAKPNVRFFVARRGTVAIGCGAIVGTPGNGGEIKRMWIDPSIRRAGVGRLLLAALIAHARAEGLRLLRLETGIAQPEAIALYRAAGFADCPPFGDYKPDPLSLFMELPLSTAAGA